MSHLGIFLDIAEQFFAPKKNCTKVLILEDDPEEGKVLCDIVRAAGFDPELFVSRRDAESWMRRGNYAAGVFDLKIPDGTGEEAQQYFERRFPDAPTLIVSGSEEALLKIIQRGVAVSVSWKGQDFRLMELAVKRMLQRAKPASGNRWSTREVLLFLLILAATNYGTWQLCCKLLKLKSP